MRKVTKILLSVLSAIILLLIIFPLLMALLLAVPAVQNVAIDKAATWAGNYLGTTVKVGNITVGLLNRIAVRDFYVADWDGDTLLYVKRGCLHWSISFDGQEKPCHQLRKYSGRQVRGARN